MNTSPGAVQSKCMAFIVMCITLAFVVKHHALSSFTANRKMRTICQGLVSKRAASSLDAWKTTNNSRTTFLEAFGVLQHSGLAGQSAGKPMEACSHPSATWGISSGVDRWFHERHSTLAQIDAEALGFRQQGSTVSSYVTDMLQGRVLSVFDRLVHACMQACTAPITCSLRYAPEPNSSA